MSVKVAINGLGRIGRMMLRASLGNPDVEIAAINDLTDPATLAHLITYDSVHGKINAEVRAKDGAIEINGRNVPVTSIKDPEKLEWKEFGIDIVAECTGAFRDREAAAKHISAGAKKVIISAPAKNPDATIVLGVNESIYDPANHHIVSNASCTTNCLAPVVKVIKEKFGFINGMMTTVHSYTNDQRILDLPHKDLRRARAAALSMIPTTTGAAKAVALVIPELKGKINGLSIRVPTPNVSIVDLVATVEKQGITIREVNQALKEASETNLKGILSFCELELVSTDFNGSVFSSVVDGPTTDTIGNMVKVLAWYDNESGYSNRMVDLCAFIGKKL